MLYDPARHETLIERHWDERHARDAIARIVADTEARFSADAYWPIHPRDVEGSDDGPTWPLYHGACGVIWALTYLEGMGAATLARNYLPFVEPVRVRNAQWLAAFGPNASSYLMGDVPNLLLEYGIRPRSATLDRLETLIESNVDHPARELMWGSPGTMLAALFLHDSTGEARWSELFRATAHKLRSQLAWSDKFGCEYWTQDLYGQKSTYLDAVHGFVATALPLIRGRHLLGSDAWTGWSATIANTIRATATHENGMVNWRAWLTQPSTRPLLMQFCHGAPGFVICLADMPGSDLDDLLLGCGRCDLGRRSAYEGLQSVPRDCGQRLCVPETLRANGRRAVARTRARVRHACDRRRRTPTRGPSAGCDIRCGPAIRVSQSTCSTAFA